MVLDNRTTAADDGIVVGPLPALDAPDKLPDLSHFKIPPVWVSSDDCEVFVGQVIEDGKVAVQGTAYNVHKGEKVAVLPLRNMRQTLDIMAFMGHAANQPGDLESMGAWSLSLDDKLEDLLETVANHVVAWTWTGMAGEPLPQPYKRPDVLRALETDEFRYLFLLLQENNPEARKNGSGPSATTSGPMGQTPDQG